jgi:cytochrome c-type biogenesis protein CcmH
MTFWIITIGLALVVALLLGMALLRPRSDGEPAAAYDLRVYRDQLKEVDRDAARGLIGEADAERVRAEVSRRILAADAALQAETDAGGQARPATLVVAALSGVAVILGSLMLYQSLGAPGYGDLALTDRIALAEEARQNRPAQTDAEARALPLPVPDASPDFIALMEQLRATVAERPDDLQGQTLLAMNEARMGDFIAAHAAQAEVLRLKGAEATAEDFANYADLLVLAAGGYVSPEAEVALAAALERDPQNGAARYYWGLMMAQTGRPDVAFDVWQVLLRDSQPDAPWFEPVRQQIEDMADRAGANFRLPPDLATAPRGPSAADVEAAGEMTPEERMAMIRGMVEGLSERLGSEGGPPEEWTRLMGALLVLGDQAQAIDVYNNALEVFADAPDALEAIRDGAREVGLIAP